MLNKLIKVFIILLQNHYFLPYKNYPLKKKKIIDDFTHEKFDLNDSESLDSWVAFYYKFGRFPGSQNLVILPEIYIPQAIKSSTQLSPIDLYKKFNAGQTKGLVSIQALAALLVHFGGDRIIAKNAMSEWQYNLLFQTLSKENDSLVMQFENVGKLVYSILHVLSLKGNEYVDAAKFTNKNLIKKLNKTDFKIEDAPEIELQKEAKNR